MVHPTEGFRDLPGQFHDCFRRIRACWSVQLPPESSNNRIVNISHEALQRLEQCAWLIHRILRLELIERSARGPEYMIELETMTESFYYFAHRFLELCENHPAFGLRRVNVRSIRLLRNHLIEHEDRPQGVIGRIFMTGFQGGPIVKPMGPGKRPKSAGVYVHAAELVQSLRRALDVHDVRS